MTYVYRIRFNQWYASPLENNSASKMNKYSWISVLKCIFRSSTWKLVFCKLDSYSYVKEMYRLVFKKLVNYENKVFEKELVYFIIRILKSFNLKNWKNIRHWIKNLFKWSWRVWLHCKALKKLVSLHELSNPCF